MSFFKTYQASVPAVKKLCVDVLEDVGRFKRAGFIKCRDLYCGFKQSDLELTRIPPTPAGLEDHLKANRKKQEESKGLLRGELERLAKYAK